MNSAIRTSHQPLKPLGTPTSFTSGPFAARTFRAELVELQKADLGRKYARKDRRPLDPPPVVQVKLFEVFNEGTPKQFEREVEDESDLNGFGTLCHVDLFPVPDPDDPTDDKRGHRRPRIRNPFMTAPLTRPPDRIDERPASGTATAHAIPGVDSLPSTNHSPLDGAFRHSVSHDNASSSHTAQQPSLHLVTRQTHVQPSYHLESRATFPGERPIASGSNQDHSRHLDVSTAASQSDVVAYVNGFPITESSKCTTALAGTKFVQAACLEYQGKRALMFVFSDLAVKFEGTFILRYRVFDILSFAGENLVHPVLAECYGGTFKVYSTKTFPGLRPSTGLTKHLSLYGVRLNSREYERKNTKQGGASRTRAHPSPLSGTTSPPASGPKGRQIITDGRHDGARGSGSKGKSASQEEPDGSSESDEDVDMHSPSSR